MRKEIICIVCPNSCKMSLVIENGELIDMSGASCEQGEEYAAREIVETMRTFSSLVKVTNGTLPLVSVRVSDVVPKERIFDIIAILKELSISAPVEINQIIIHDVLGLGVDVIATKDVKKVIS